MKVKVIKCSVPTFWYADKIGQVFDVLHTSISKQFHYKCVDNDWYFDKEDVMVIKKHKHADLIHAFADGAEIQISNNNIHWHNEVNPNWDAYNYYRIKPVERIPVYPIMKSFANNQFADSILRIFVSSGDLAKYVEKYGVDGLKGQ